MSLPSTITPTDIRYIKLGAGGAWVDEALRDNLLMFKDEVPHQMALGGDVEAAKAVYAARNPKSVGNRLRELSDFYKPDARRLWITFGQGHLWWTHAEGEVTQRADGVRIRRCVDRWRCTDLEGRELRTSDLSSSLTKVTGYRGTICGFDAAAAAYLIRRLNAAEDDAVSAVRALQAGLQASVETLVEGLHWRSFELLVDLVFAAGGWKRVSSIGGSHQAETDLVLEQPITGERAFVQVKSKADVAVYRNCLEQYRASGLQRFFFICHSPKGDLVSEASDVHVWQGAEIARQAVRAGLVDWLVENRA